MRSCFILTLFFLVSCSSYTYRDEWHVIHKINSQTKVEDIGPRELYKIPGSSCILSPVVKKDDSVSRVIACAKTGQEVKMGCSYSNNSINDEVAECDKAVEDVVVVTNIKRIPNDKIKASFKEPKTKSYQKLNEYTYDNVWTVISEQNNNNVNYRTQSEHLTKVPNIDCALGPVIHSTANDEDKFSRAISCFGENNFQETFECQFDKNFKDEDNEKDEYKTRCSKKIGNILAVMTIRRYPAGFDASKEQLKKEIESNKTY